MGYKATAKSLGGLQTARWTGHIADVAQSYGVKAGDPYVRKLIAHGLMRQPTRDFYVLTPDAYAMANLLISKGM